MPMDHSDYRTLVNRGRRAGLNTAELYQALATCPQDSLQHYLGMTDSNGFVAHYDQQGHQAYLPSVLLGRSNHSRDPAPAN